MRSSIILLAIVLAGCSTERQCRKAAIKCGWKSDTVELWDSVRIERTITDTLVDFHTLSYYDTIRIDRDRVRIQLVRLPGDSIFVQAECKDTTIRYVKTIVTRTVKIYGESPWYILLGIAAVWFWLGLILRNRLPI